MQHARGAEPAAPRYAGACGADHASVRLPGRYGDQTSRHANPRRESDMFVIGRESIAGMIPHAGTMCMIDAVVSWDATSLRCLSRSHHDPANPMRRPDGVLSAACGIEIAAQAMALHGRLLSKVSAPPVRGLLVSVRDVH